MIKNLHTLSYGPVTKIFAIKPEYFTKTMVSMQLILLNVHGICRNNRSHEKIVTINSRIQVTGKIEERGRTLYPFFYTGVWSLLPTYIVGYFILFNENVAR